MGWWQAMKGVVTGAWLRRNPPTEKLDIYEDRGVIFPPGMDEEEVKDWHKIMGDSKPGQGNSGTK